MSIPQISLPPSVGVLVGGVGAGPVLIVPTGVSVDGSLWDTPVSGGGLRYRKSSKCKHVASSDDSIVDFSLIFTKSSNLAQSQDSSSWFNDCYVSSTLFTNECSFS